MGQGRLRADRAASGDTGRGGSAAGRAVLVARTPAQLPGPGDVPRVYSVEDLGMPAFDYAPADDGRPEPGEVLWTWVPFEEDRSQGKDRPVVVLAEAGPCIVFAQLTSKDHDRDAAREARSGRRWLDVGAGGWDSKGRPSEARIDRLLCVRPERVRREGGALDGSRFTELVAAIRACHG